MCTLLYLFPCLLGLLHQYSSLYVQLLVYNLQFLGLYWLAWNVQLENTASQNPLYPVEGHTCEGLWLRTWERSSFVYTMTAICLNLVDKIISLPIKGSQNQQWMKYSFHWWHAHLHREILYINGAKESFRIATVQCISTINLFTMCRWDVWCILLAVASIHSVRILLSWAYIGMGRLLLDSLSCYISIRLAPPSLHSSTIIV